MSSAHDRRTVSRRAFVAGSAATLLAASCGSTGEASPTSNATSTSDSTPTNFADERILAKLFAPAMVVSGKPIRMAFGVADGNGALLNEEAPPSATFVFDGFEGQGETRVADVARRSEGIPRAYFPVSVTFEKPGNYELRMERSGADDLTGAVTVLDPSTLAVPGVGEPMLGVVTPTSVDDQGLTSLCTLVPEPCGFHSRSVDEVLKEGGAAVVIVSTPAFCQTGICGPTLEVLVDEAPKYPDLAIVHTEVFLDGAAQPPEIVNAVGELGLSWEPSLFVVGADGLVAARLDNIYDVSELRDSIALVI